MRTLAISLAALTICSAARADTFVIDYQARPQVDPEATFQADCLGASEAPDCATRAALLEGELVEGLAALEGLSDDATKALFTSAVTSGSDSVKEVGLRYYARRRDLPATLWTNVKAFFFGPSAQVGQPSAELLDGASDTKDQELGEQYLKLRPSSVYGLDLRTNEGEADEWAKACAADARLDEVPAFAESELFAPASRLLMIDRFLVDYQTGMASIPGSGFVTDAPRAEVVAFFDKLFGKKASPPIAESEAKLQALNAELTALQPRLASGDREAIMRVTAIADEITALSSAVTSAAVLQLDEDACADCVYWLAGDAQDVLGGAFTRAVVVGTQPLLARTMISYLGSGGQGPSMPQQDGGVPTERPDSGSVSQGDASAEPTPTRKSDGGCSTHGDATGGAWLLALGLFVRRRRQGQFM
ncbi:MAG: MYXO-CTERM sorting domain-containing protein [Polyangiales bacterium]